MTSNEQTHPTGEMLAAFAQGRLEDAAAITIAEHLDTCQRCQQAVLATPDDRLFSLLGTQQHTGASS